MNAHVFFPYNKPKIVSMFMCVVKLTFTHTVAFFGSDQNNNPKNVINDGLVYVSFPTSVRRIHL